MRNEGWVGFWEIYFFTTKDSKVFSLRTQRLIRTERSELDEAKSKIRNRKSEPSRRRARQSQIRNITYMNYIVLITGTIIIILFSWFLSIKYRRYHGISRFFAFESIFILFLLNRKLWFDEPLTPLHILSWIFLLFSIYPVVTGYILLKRKGKPTVNFENTSVLVRSGIYRYIRHPLYLSIFLFGTGVMLKDPGPLQILLGAFNLIAVYITARIEEGEMSAKFGNEYMDYMKETKMFIPFLF